jgi:hypothetical protein
MLDPYDLSAGLIVSSGLVYPRCRLQAGFRFVWDDGPFMTYREVPGRSYAENLYYDSLGGAWHFRDLRDGRSFDLVNTKNGNVIQCR